MRLTTILLLCVSLQVLAQTQPESSETISKVVPEINEENTKSYFRLSLGYRAATGIGVFSKYAQTSTTNVKSYVYSSSGKGIPISVALGTYLNKGLAIEFEITYKAARGTKVNNAYYDSSTDIYTSQTSTFVANEFQFSPRLIGESRAKSIVFQYKVGLLLSLGNSKSTQKETYQKTGYKNWEGNYEWENTHKPGLGYSGGFGIRKRINQDVSFIADVSFIQLGRWSEKSTMTESVENGINTLEIRPVSSKEYVAVDEIDLNQVQDPNKATPYLRYKTEYSSVGFSIGFIQHF